MKFESIKILPQMRTLYDLPRTQARFDQYLLMLQGTDGRDMILPIAAFNPMAKALAIDQLDRLIELKAEDILEEVVFQFNKQNELSKNENSVIKVAVNLIDDVEGAWSNYYATDYKSKFEFDNLLKRNFCTPVFWTSENFTETQITRRIKAYMNRTLFWLTQGKPTTLASRFKQEIFVQMNSGIIASNLDKNEAKILQSFLGEHANVEDYAININFFYGDEGSSDLNYATYGISKNGGFELSKYIAYQNN